MSDSEERGLGYDVTWPRGQVIEESEGQVVHCSSCGLRWLVHFDLAGYRMRCDCGLWIEVPELLSQGERDSRLLQHFDGRPDEHVLQRRVDEARQVAPARDVLEELPRDSAHRDPFREPRRVDPGQVVQAGALEDADLRSRTRWLNRTLLEIVGMLGAIMAPQLVMFLSFPAHLWLEVMPLSSLIGGVLVLIVGAFSRGYTFGAVRGFRPTFGLEAVLAAVVFVVLAIGYTDLLTPNLPEAGEGGGFESLRDDLGVGFSLFVIALCPAIFEELAFRGLLQGRFSALFGQWQGLLLSSIFFALAHSLTPGLPFHFGLGLYFGWIRIRSGSVIPGMILHFCYNGGLVLFST